MIDIATETIITLEDAAKRLLVSKTSVYGWVTRGFKGVRLEAFRVGGCWRTSVEALQRFANAQTPGHNQLSVPGPNEPPASASRAATSRERQRQIEAAERQLDEMLGIRFCAECDTKIEWLKGSAPKTGKVWCPRCLVTQKSATLGQRIRVFRCAAFHSQPTLSSLTRIGVDLIRAYEYDEKTPTDDHLAKFVGVLGEELVKGLARYSGGERGKVET